MDWNHLDGPHILLLILIVLGVGLVLALLAAICHAFYCWMDVWGQIKQSLQTRILDKNYEPESSGIRPQLMTTTGVNGQLSTSTIFLPYTDPAVYQCLVDFKGNQEWVDVPPALFERLKVQDSVTANYRVGRLSGKSRLDSISAN